MTQSDKESQGNHDRVTSEVKMAVLLRALRNAFAMSQAALAEQAGSSRPTLNRIETLAKQSVRSNTLDNLLQVFRDEGVEITVGDTELNIRFTRKALMSAGSAIEESATPRNIGFSVSP